MKPITLKTLALLPMLAVGLHAGAKIEGSLDPDCVVAE